MLESLRRFSALGRPAQALFLRALGMLPLVSLSLRLRGFERTRRTLKRKLPRSVAREDCESVNKQAALTAHMRSEEHTSELQSRFDLVCRLLLEKKKKKR